MKQADGWLLSAFALTGVWENLLKFRRVIFKMFLSTDKKVFCLLINLRSKPLNVRSEPLNVRSKPLNGDFIVV